MAFVCGVIQHRAQSVFDTGRWSWPFGRVDLREDELRLYTPVFVGRFALHVRYEDIDRVALRAFRWGGKLRLHRRALGEDVTVLTVGDSYLRIADLLRAKDVVVSK